MGWVVRDAFVAELDAVGFASCLECEELESGAETVHSFYCVG